MRKAFIQNSFLKKIARKHYLIVGAVILVITVTHFVLQVSFIQTENLQVVENSVSKDVEPGNQTAGNKVEGFDAVVEDVIIEAVDKPEKINETTSPKPVRPVARRQSEPRALPPRILPRKKINRESRAERLRRAERILTGI